MARKAKSAERKMDAQYLRALNKLVDELFTIADQQRHWTWETLADKSGLSRQTIYKLGARVTKYPQYRTVELLAHALGGRLSFSKSAATAVGKRQWTLKMFTTKGKKARGKSKAA